MFYLLILPKKKKEKEGKQRNKREKEPEGISQGRHAGISLAVKFN
jgi:hypothetical protein